MKKIKFQTKASILYYFFKSIAYRTDIFLCPKTRFVYHGDAFPERYNIHCDVSYKDTLYTASFQSREELSQNAVLVWVCRHDFGIPSYFEL